MLIIITVPHVTQTQGYLFWCRHFNTALCVPSAPTPFIWAQKSNSSGSKLKPPDLCPRDSHPGLESLLMD
ncbi:hypothetical protein XELAEV_18028257mg [Xenopus laevis]|uniref:Uncharacterized protein n=1 Tax=Xenopus laevis TaxID=8355 RepID=A0A974HKE0_XENLA|nr:hypothetical protein XELAEV_18028257mg [Xenopus laevis]